MNDLNKFNRPTAGCLTRFRLVAVILMLLSFLSGGCDAYITVPSGEGHPTVVTATTAGTADSAWSETIVSGTLRLWMPRPDSYHPLINTEVNYYNICNLLYQSLYTSDGQGVLVPELADGHGEWDEAGRTYTVRLRPDLRFSDDTPLTAERVQAIMTYIAQHDRSPYKAALQNLEAVDIPDERTLVFYLHQRDPFFIYLLQFPICNVASAPSGEFPPPGTGRYAVAETKVDGGLRLTPNPHWQGGVFGKIENVDVRVFSDYETALQAFTADELDLIPLPYTSFAELIRRQNVSIRAFPSLHYYFVNYHIERQDPPFADEDDLLYVKQVVAAADLTAADDQSDLLDPEIYPLHPTLSGHSDTARLSPQTELLPEDYTWPEGKRPILLIYQHEDALATRLAQALAAALERAGVAVDLNSLYSEDFSDRLAEGIYDMAICNMRLGVNPDPGWMYGRTSAHLPAGAEHLRQTAFASYETAVRELAAFTTIKSESPLDLPQYYDLLQACEHYAPFSGIGFAFEGVMIGPRVRGNIGSHAMDPYGGIEEIWIWSGQ